jgi:hypothetical protein
MNLRSDILAGKAICARRRIKLAQRDCMPPVGWIGWARDSLATSSFKRRREASRSAREDAVSFRWPYLRENLAMHIALQR